MTEKNVVSELNGRVWKIEVHPGDRVSAEDTLIILESMKMEIPVTAPVAGQVKQVVVKEEELIAEGQLLVILET